MTANALAACYGEVLWDILPHADLPGGAPMNVAYHLQQLGTPTGLITRIGKDERGRQLLDLFEQKGLPARWVQEDAGHHTGIVYATVGAGHEVTYDIVKPVAWDFIEWSEELERAVSAADLFIFGSLGARSSTSRDTLFRLLPAARTKVFDINLRPPHVDRQVIEHLMGAADMVKINEAELAMLTDWYFPGQAPENSIRHLQARFDLSTLIVTLGSAGALVSDGHAIYRQPGYSVQVADTIGSGDSFLAGFLHQTRRGASLPEALQFGCALGALVASRPGGCPDYTPSEVQALISSQPAASV